VCLRGHPVAECRLQTGNNECWRNERLDGIPFKYSSDWVAPNSGFLQFDFVSTKRSLYTSVCVLMYVLAGRPLMPKAQSLFVCSQLGIYNTLACMYHNTLFRWAQLAAHQTKSDALEWCLDGS
jgi:hypothetical protein